MNVHNYKKEGGAIGVNVAYQPAVIDIAHDALHTVKRHLRVGRIVKG